MVKDYDPLNQSQSFSEIDKRLGEIRAEQKSVEDTRNKEAQVSSVRSRLGRGAVSGLTQAVAGIPQGLAVLQGAIDDAPLQERGLYKAGESLQKYVDEDVLKLTPEEQNTFVTQVGKGLGQVAGLAVPGGLLGKAGSTGKALAYGTGTIAGSGMAAHEGVQDYISTRNQQGKEIDPQELGDTAFYNSLRGLTEMIPVTKFLKTGKGLSGSIVTSTEKGGLRSIQRGTQKTAKAKLAQVAGEAAKGLTYEGAQEAFDQLALNAIAKGLVKYDPDRNLFTDLKESAEVGGTVGAIFNTAMGALGLRARGRYEQAVQNQVDAGVAQARDETMEKAVNPDTEQEYTNSQIKNVARRISTFQKLKDEAASRRSPMKLDAFGTGPSPEETYGGDKGYSNILEKYDSRIDELTSAIEEKFLAVGEDGKPVNKDPIAIQEAKALIKSIKGEEHLKGFEPAPKKVEEVKSVVENGGQLSLFNKDDTPSKNFVNWAKDNGIHLASIEGMRNAPKGSTANDIFNEIEIAYLEGSSWSEAEIPPDYRSASQDPKVLEMINELDRKETEAKTALEEEGYPVEEDGEVITSEGLVEFPQQDELELEGLNEEAETETIIPQASDAPVDIVPSQQQEAEVSTDEAQDTLTTPPPVQAPSTTQRAKKAVATKKAKKAVVAPVVEEEAIPEEAPAVEEVPQVQDVRKKDGKPFAGKGPAKVAANRAEKSTGVVHEAVAIKQGNKVVGWVARPTGAKKASQETTQPVKNTPPPTQSQEVPIEDPIHPLSVGEGGAITPQNLATLEQRWVRMLSASGDQPKVLSLTRDLQSFLSNEGDFNTPEGRGLYARLVDNLTNGEIDPFETSPDKAVRAAKADIEDADRGGYTAPQEHPVDVEELRTDELAQVIVEESPTVEEVVAELEPSSRIVEIEDELQALEERLIDYEMEGKNPQAIEAKVRKLTAERGKLQSQVNKQNAKLEEDEAVRIANEEGGIDGSEDLDMFDPSIWSDAKEAVSNMFSVSKGNDIYAYHDISDEQIAGNKAAVERFASRLKIPASELKIVYIERFEDIKDKKLLKNFKKRYNPGMKIGEGLPNAIITKDNEKPGPRTIYISGRANRTVKEIETTLLHEIVGHFGMSKLFGESWQSFLFKSIRNTPKLFQKAYDLVVVRRKYSHLSARNPIADDAKRITVLLNGHRVEMDQQVAMDILEEYISMAAESIESDRVVDIYKGIGGFGKRLVAWVRHMLRSFGIGTDQREYKLTDGDILSLLTEVHSLTFKDSIYATNNVRDFQVSVEGPNNLALITDTQGTYFIDDTGLVSYINEGDVDRLKKGTPSQFEIVESILQAQYFITKSISRLSNKNVVKKSAVLNILNQKDITKLDKGVVVQVLNSVEGDTIARSDLVRAIDATLVRLSVQETGHYADYGINNLVGRGTTDDIFDQFEIDDLVSDRAEYRRTLSGVKRGIKGFGAYSAEQLIASYRRERDAAESSGAARPVYSRVIKEGMVIPPIGSDHPEDILRRSLEAKLIPNEKYTNKWLSLVEASLERNISYIDERLAGISKMPKSSSVILNAPFETPKNMHFPMAENYAGHYRLMDVGTDRYILEIQSDLAQRGSKLSVEEIVGFKKYVEDLTKARKGLVNELYFLEDNPTLITLDSLEATNELFRSIVSANNINLPDFNLYDRDTSLMVKRSRLLRRGGSIRRMIDTRLLMIEEEVSTAVEDPRWNDQLKPYINERLVREAVYMAKIQGQENLYLPTGDVVAKVEGWRMSEDASEFLTSNLDEAATTEYKRVSNYLQNNPGKVPPLSLRHATIWLKYETEFPKMYKKEFNVDINELHTDEYGHEWYSVNLADDSHTIKSEGAEMIIMASQPVYQKDTVNHKQATRDSAKLKSNWWQKSGERVMSYLRQNEVVNYFSAMGKMPNETLYDNINLEAKGLISKSDIQIRHLKRVFKKHQDPKVKAQIHKFFTTRGADINDIPALNKLERSMIEKAKTSIEELGEEFVKLGILKRDVYEANKGAYLPIRYYQYITAYPGGGKRPSFMNYLKKQNKDITEADKVAMGRIQDPEFAVIETVATMSRDIALLKMFKNIRGMSKEHGLFWTLEDEVYATLRGRKVPLATIDERITHYEQLISDGVGGIFNYTEKDINQLKAFLDEAVRAKSEGEADFKNSVKRVMESQGLEYNEESYKDFLYQNYVKMPNDYVYGALRNRWIRKEIYQDITDAYEHNQVDKSSTFSRWFAPGGHIETGHQYWKMMKVPFNIPSWFRNSFGNAILLDISSNTNSAKLGKMVIDTFMLAIKGDPYLYKTSELKGTAKDPYRFNRIAIEKGLFGTTFSTQELYLTQQTTIDEAKRRLARAAMKDKKMGFLKGSFQSSMWWSQERFYEMSEMANQMYGGLEGIFKTVALQDYIETWESQNGMSIDQAGPEMKQKVIDEAALHANEAIFDYSKIPNFLRMMRRYPLGAPFLTFTYKSLGAITRGFAYHPQKFIKYAALPYIMAQAFLMNNDLDDEDLEEIKRKFPLWMKDKMSVYILPWKDANGNWQAMDFGYMFPWEIWQNYGLYVKNHFDSTSPGMSSLEMAGAAVKQLGFATGPLPNTLTAFFTNKDDFTGREIITTGAPESQQLNELMGFLINMWAPTFVSQNGFLGMMMDEFGIEKTPFNSGRQVDKYGNDRRTMGQAGARLFGLNTYSVDPEVSNRQNIKAFESQMQKLKKARTATMRDRNLGSDTRARLLKEHNEKIKRLNSKKSDYLEGN